MKNFLRASVLCLMVSASVTKPMELAGIGAAAAIIPTAFVAAKYMYCGQGTLQARTEKSLYWFARAASMGAFAGMVGPILSCIPVDCTGQSMAYGFVGTVSVASAENALQFYRDIR